MGRMKNLAELVDGKKLNGSNKEDQPVKVFWRLRRRIIHYENGKTRVGILRSNYRFFTPLSASGFNHMGPFMPGHLSYMVVETLRPDDPRSCQMDAHFQP